MVQSFIYAHFNYCPLIWHFKSSMSLLKIENIQKRALRFLYNDKDSSYEELLIKANRNHMHVYRLKILCTEIYKTISEMNPTYIKGIFHQYTTDRPVRSQYLCNLKVVRVNQNTFGTNSLTSLGPKIWNNIPCSLKGSENLINFKQMITIILIFLSYVFATN